MIKLLHDWPERLSTFIEARRFMPFEWGVNDCALFSADGILCMSDIDLASRWRGYSTATEAMSLVKSHDGMANLALSVGLIEKPIGFASRGNVVLSVLEGRDTFGLVAGNGFWAGPGARGMVMRPMGEITAAFGF